MSDKEKLKNKFHSAFKLSGFLVRREFCSLIIEKFAQENVDVANNHTFDACIRNLCSSLEKQCLSDRSIEREHIDQAIEIFLHSGCDKTETMFNVINAFDFPKFDYDPDRKLYVPARVKSKLLSEPSSKAQLFIERYRTILQRIDRNFKNKITPGAKNKLLLQTVDFLLTSNSANLDMTLILGSLLQVSEGKYYLEDPSGIVELDLTHASYNNCGFVVENSFMLVNGFYEDRKLQVKNIIAPPGEESKDSRIMFGNLNYFGGPSPNPLRDSKNLQELLHRNPHNMIFFLSDVWLDHPLVFEKLETMFNGIQDSPPYAFVFMGNFIEELHGLENMEVLRKLFRRFGELISHYPSIINNSQFVFVPGMSDPATPHVVPRQPLPSYITEDFKKNVPQAIFATNPCRLQYCNKEITLFRADTTAKLMQGTINKPEKKDIADYITGTILGQGHLSPVALNALTVHWDFDYTLRLYPLPNLVVLGDKSEAYQGKYKGCQLVNPGSFCERGFQFTCYIPTQDLLQECSVNI